MAGPLWSHSLTLSLPHRILPHLRNVEYPFDVEGVIEALADHVDLVLVFLDPIGQALVSRTMNVVRRLHNAGHGPKTMFFMTKMDTVYVYRREANRKYLHPER